MGSLIIGACIVAAFSRYGNEVIQLFSRIKKTMLSASQMTPPTTRRQRELQSLEFGVNYDRASVYTSGMLVPYV